MTLPFPREHDPCPHCRRPMRRPVLERLSSPFCKNCLEERRAAFTALHVGEKEARTYAADRQRDFEAEWAGLPAGEGVGLDLPRLSEREERGLRFTEQFAQRRLSP